MPSALASRKSAGKSESARVTPKCECWLPNCIRLRRRHPVAPSRLIDAPSAWQERQLQVSPNAFPGVSRLLPCDKSEGFYNGPVLDIKLIREKPDYVQQRL